MNDDKLKETLKYCPEGTFEALKAFRQDGDPDQLVVFVKGAMIRHLDPDQTAALEAASDDARLIDDVGIDSLTLTEVVVMIEECLDISIPNEDLMQLETWGSLKSYLHQRAKSDEGDSV